MTSLVAITRRSTTDAGVRTGTRAPADFVETPSHLLEYFAYDHRYVCMCACMYVCVCMHVRFGDHHDCDGMPPSLPFPSLSCRHVLRIQPIKHRVLREFAHHHRTQKPIPEELTK